MSALVLSVHDPEPLLPGDLPGPATLTVATQAGSADASVTGAFKGRIQAPSRGARQWPHHLTVAATPDEPASFTR